MKNTFIKVLSFMMAMVIVLGTCIVVTSAADEECTHANATQYGDPVAETCTEWGYTIYECPDCTGNDKFFAKDFVAPHMHGKEWEDEEVVKPTCTEKGYTKGTCLVCGEVNKWAETKETGHTKNKGTVIDPGTCLEKGTIEYTCTVCSYVWTEETAANGHKFAIELDTIKAPTCNSEGLAIYACVNCDVTKEVAIAKIENHKFAFKAAVAATCETNGNTAGNYCTICGVADPSDANAQILPKLDHVGHTQTVTKPATCLEKGVMSHYCAICGKAWTTEIKLADHDWGSKPTAEAAPDCVKYGYKLWGCTKCGTARAESLAPLGHDYETVGTVYPPTCTEGGYTGYKCKNCNDVKKVMDASKPATGHDLYVSKPAQAADCENPGWTEEKTCNNCGKVIVASTEIPANKHQWKVLTCTEQQKQMKYCEACGKKENIATPNISAGAEESHALIFHTYAPKPTCDTAGKAIYYCDFCGHSEVIDVAATGHTWGAATVVAPTCVAEGYTIRTCTTCGDDEITNVTAIDPTAHGTNTVSIEVLTTANCTVQGNEVRLCQDCGKTYYHITPALGHTIKTIAAVAPTCTTPGSTAGSYCDVCKIDLVKVEPLKALGHDLEVTKGYAATCTTKGLTDAEDCKRCDYKKDATEIPALGHAWGAAAAKTNKLPVYAGQSIDASCKGEGNIGFTYHVCTRVDDKGNSVCDAEYLQNYNDAPEHAWSAEKQYSQEKAGWVACLDDDYKYIECTSCNLIEIDEETRVKALGHQDDEKNAIPTDCTRGKIKDIHCVLCNKDIDIIHPEDQCTFKTIPATCIDYQYTIRVCKKCDTSEVVNIDDSKLGEHTWVKKDSESKAPTFDKAGVLVEYCSVCNEKKVTPQTAGVKFSGTIVSGINAEEAIVNGGTVVVTIKVKGAEQALNNLKFDITYNTKVLTFQKYEADNFIGKAGTEIDAFNKDGKITVTAFAANDADGKVQDVVLNGEETFMTLYFKVNSTALDETDKVSITVAGVEVIDKDSQAVNVAIDTIKAADIEKLADVTGDGMITNSDALAVKKMISGEADDTYTAVADVDRDGEITINDFKLIQNCIVGRKTYAEISA